MLDERGEGDGNGTGGGPEPAPGTLVAGFVLQERLATGSSGSVYRAERGGRRFAIKLVPLDTWGEREVDALRRVRHTSVVGLLGYGQWPEDAPRFLALAMELVEGPTLDAWARGNPRTARTLVRQVLLPLVEALGEVHAAGVVHRDVKEANVVMRRADGRPVLVDFGAARFEGAPRLTTRLPPGTPEYRSPEMLRFARQWEGEPYASQPADDWWALGVSLYALLTRTLPFGDRHGPLSRRILEHAPEAPHVLNPHVPRALGEVCLRMLEKRPEARYASAGDLTRALEAALAGADASWGVPLFTGEPARTSAVPGPRPIPSRPEVSRGRLRPLALGLLAALVLHPSPRGIPSEMGHSTPRTESPGSRPPREAGFRQELADIPKTAEVVPRAELLESQPAAPANATLREDPPPMRKPTPGRSLMKSTLVSAACVSASCASTPPPPPRLPAECPPGYRETHARFDMEGSWVHPLLLISVRETAYYNPLIIPIQEGPRTAYITSPWNDLPNLTRLHGEIYFEGNRVHGQFTQLQLATGETYPVCLYLSDGAQRGIEMYKGSRPGKVRVLPAHFVQTWRYYR